jgi:YVTN family beta-propeller protein
LWIGNDAAGGVTVIDTGTLKVAAQISTGAGRHEIVISSDNRFAFVSNRESGTVSIVDVRKLERVTDVKVGPGPVSLALSELSKAIYAVSESDGSVAVIDAQGQLLTRMKAKPGSHMIRFAPGG